MWNTDGICSSNNIMELNPHVYVFDILNQFLFSKLCIIATGCSQKSSGFKKILWEVKFKFDGLVKRRGELFPCIWMGVTDWSKDVMRRERGGVGMGLLSMVWVSANRNCRCILKEEFTLEVVLRYGSQLSGLTLSPCHINGRTLSFHHDSWEMYASNEHCVFK